jgi:hypothetical protein
LAGLRLGQPQPITREECVSRVAAVIPQSTAGDRRGTGEAAIGMAILTLSQRAHECTDVVALMGEAMQIARVSLGVTSCTIVRRLAGGEIRVVAPDGWSSRSAAGCWALRARS